MIVSEPEWLDLILRVFTLAPIALVWVILVTRFIGLRSFSKMTTFDFVVTVATGSLLANAATASEWSGWLQASLAIFVLLFAQACLTWLRRRSDEARSLMENEPLILFRDGQWIEDNLTKTRTTRSDIWAKMREANVLQLESVRTVVLETTGDISVLHGDVLDKTILTNVKSPR